MSEKHEPVTGHRLALALFLLVRGAGGSYSAAGLAVSAATVPWFQAEAQTAAPPREAPSSDFKVQGKEPR